VPTIFNWQLDPMKSPIRLIILVLCVSFVSYVGACTDTHSDAADTGNPLTADVAFDTHANDEALDLLLDASPTDIASKAAIFDSPTDAAALDKGVAVAFKWHTGATADSQNPGTIRHKFQPIWQFGVPAAYAHGPTLNGKAYFLVVSSTADAKVLRVFTTATTFTPNSEQWTKITKASGTLTAIITTAVYDNDKLASDGGPFSGKPITFTIKP